MTPETEFRIREIIERLERYRYPVKPEGSDSGPEWLDFNREHYRQATDDAIEIIAQEFPTMSRTNPTFSGISTVTWLYLALLERPA